MTTQQLINQSYQIVQQDLLNTFAKMKNGEKTRLSNIGTFEKKFKQGQSYLPASYGQNYQSYYIVFRMSKVLKKNLNK